MVVIIIVVVVIVVVVGIVVIVVVLVEFVEGLSKVVSSSSWGKRIMHTLIGIDISGGTVRSGVIISIIVIIIGLVIVVNVGSIVRSHIHIPP